MKKKQTDFILDWSKVHQNFFSVVVITIKGDEYSFFSEKIVFPSGQKVDAKNSQFKANIVNQDDLIYTIDSCKKGVFLRFHTRSLEKGIQKYGSDVVIKKVNLVMSNRRYPKPIYGKSEKVAIVKVESTVKILKASGFKFLASLARYYGVYIIFKDDNCFIVTGSNDNVKKFQLYCDPSNLNLSNQQGRKDEYWEKSA